MIKNEISIGKNRTGIELSPIDKREMLEIAKLTIPSTGEDGAALAEARGEYYIGEDEPIGTVPPPASLKGIAGAGVSALRGVDMTVFIDKLGERLAFERTGARLYEAVLEKCLISEALPNGPTLADLEQIRSEELRHFELVRDAIKKMGGDPTAVTPSADVAAVASTGILQVVTDARTTLKQSLEAMLIAELVDNDGWALLIELTRVAEDDELRVSFEEARRREEEHLRHLRHWVTDATVTLAKR